MFTQMIETYGSMFTVELESVDTSKYFYQIQLLLGDVVVLKKNSVLERNISLDSLYHIRCDYPMHDLFFRLTYTPQNSPDTSLEVNFKHEIDMNVVMNQVIIPTKPVVPPWDDECNLKIYNIIDASPITIDTTDCCFYVFVMPNFDYQEARLLDDDTRRLDKIVQILNDNSFYSKALIQIYGHTDSAGTEKYPKVDRRFDNWKLAYRRDTTIQRYMEKKLSKYRRDYISVSQPLESTKPIVDSCLSEKPKSMSEQYFRTHTGENDINRRVEIIVVPECFYTTNNMPIYDVIYDRIRKKLNPNGR